MTKLFTPTPVLALTFLTWVCDCAPVASAAGPAAVQAEVSTWPKPSAVTRALPSKPLDRCLEKPAPTAVALPERVTLGDFWAALSAQIDVLDGAALRGSFEAFAVQHAVSPETPGLWRDFARLWIAFEATRDGGWWRLRWDITDQEPSSVQIWKAWLRSPPQQTFATASAVAECDEITALLAVTARHLGVRGVGLFYPTWNHVIAGWAPETLAGQGSKAIVLVPTTQIFQGCSSTFDQTSFKAPKHVYEFPRHDVSDKTEMPAALAAFLLEQVREYGEASPALLALIRTKRAELLRSSLGDCSGYRRRLVAELRPKLSCADKRALRHLATSELGTPDLSDDDVLSFLGSGAK